jgi:ribonuclease D
VPFPTDTFDVIDAAGLAGAAKAIASAPEVAVDVEADAMHHFEASLCFVQLATDAGVWLLDTLAPGVAPSALASTFADKSITKIFHAAGGDLQYLAAAGVRVKGLFDTHRAATLLGWPKVGLADLVLEKLQITLDKGHQQSDFSIRPLPDGMRAYIASDVRYLVEIGRQVKEACRAADILEEVQLDCERMEEEAAERPDVGHDFKPKLSRQGLSAAQVKLQASLAKELHTLRLQWAKAADVPMGRMLSNAAVNALATRPPRDRKELSRAEGVRGAFVREHGDEVLALIAKLQAEADAGTLPEVEDRAVRDNKARKREDALKAWRTEAAAARKVTGSVVLPNALANELADAPPANLEELARFRWLGEKRLRLYGPAILETLKKI